MEENELHHSYKENNNKTNRHRERGSDAESASVTRGKYSKYEKSKK